MVSAPSSGVRCIVGPDLLRARCSDGCARHRSTRGRNAAARSDSGPVDASLPRSTGVELSSADCSSGPPGPAARAAMREAAANEPSLEVLTAARGAAELRRAHRQPLEPTLLGDPRLALAVLVMLRVERCGGLIHLGRDG